MVGVFALIAVEISRRCVLTSRRTGGGQTAGAILRGVVWTTVVGAERLQQIAAKANLRAQIRSEQITAGLRLEVTGKIAGAGSVGLLAREEIQADESLLHQFLQYLQIHCTGVHA